jgi:hypothetical protein
MAFFSNAHFTGWKMADSGGFGGYAAFDGALPFWLIADSSTSAGYGAGVSYIFAAFKPEISASYKWFPGKNWEGTKEEYAVSFVLTPRSVAKSAFTRFIPAASVRYNATSYADSRFTSSVAASISWKFESAKIKAYAKIEASFPLQ